MNRHFNISTFRWKWMEELVRQLVPSHDPLVCMMDGMTPCPGCQAHIDQQRLKEWQEHRDRNNN